MIIIILKVFEVDKIFMKVMVKFEGVFLLEFICIKIFEVLEDEYDVCVVDLVY